LANQYRKAYKTYKATLKNWWPLFYWLIDIACINVYKLYQLHSKDNQLLTHLQFRIELYYKLLSYSTKAELRSLQVKLGGKRLFRSELPYIHY
jgi:hypothetical protein